MGVRTAQIAIFILLLLSATLDSVLIWSQSLYTAADLTAPVTGSIAAVTALGILAFLIRWERFAIYIASFLIGFSWGLCGTMAFLHLSFNLPASVLPLLALIPPTALAMVLLSSPPPYYLHNHARQHSSGNKKAT